MKKFYTVKQTKDFKLSLGNIYGNCSRYFGATFPSQACVWITFIISRFVAVEVKDIVFSKLLEIQLKCMKHSREFKATFTLQLVIVCC